MLSQEQQKKIDEILTTLEDLSPEERYQDLKETILTYRQLISFLTNLKIESNQRRFLQLVPLKLLMMRVGIYKNLGLILKPFPQTFQADLLKALPVDFVRIRLLDGYDISSFVLDYLNKDEQHDYLFAITIQFVCSKIEDRDQLNYVLEHLLNLEDKEELSKLWLSQHPSPTSPSRFLSFRQPSQNQVQNDQHSTPVVDTILSTLQSWKKLGRRPSCCSGNSDTKSTENLARRNSYSALMKKEPKSKRKLITTPPPLSLMPS